MPRTAIAIFSDKYSDFPWTSGQLHLTAVLISQTGKMDLMESIVSNKGGTTFCYNGYLNTKHLRNRRKIWWKCVKGRARFTQKMFAQFFHGHFYLHKSWPFTWAFFPWTFLPRSFAQQCSAQMSQGYKIVHITVCKFWHEQCWKTCPILNGFSLLMMPKKITKQIKNLITKCLTNARTWWSGK